MPKYYCHECARICGYVAPGIPSSGLIPATVYQLDKYIKHTAPSGIYSLNSVFNDPSWGIYQNYMIAGAASGCLQIDDAGRKNLLFFAGEETGLTYQSGSFVGS